MNHKNGNKWSVSGLLLLWPRMVPMQRVTELMIESHLCCQSWGYLFDASLVIRSFEYPGDILRLVDRATFDGCPNAALFMHDCSSDLVAIS